MNKTDLDRIKTLTKGDFFYYDSVGSTNTEALNHKDARDKSLFIAKDQTEGRGRKNRSWKASEGGIYMTILLKPEKFSKGMSWLTLAAGLAASRVISGSLIKWPNDIVLGDKKVAGILTETRIFKEKCTIAVGIGINANNREFSSDLKDKATSIYLYSGGKQDKARIISEVYCEFLKLYEDFESGFSKIREEYSKKCITLNREIIVIRDGREHIMYAKDINEAGELLAVCDGKTEVINFGEVSVRGLLGYAK